MVAGVSVSVAVPVFVGSATGTAVIITLAGRLAATVGAVYRPVLALIPPQGPGLLVHTLVLPKAQVTPVLLLALVTVAMNCAC
jgi:hypothetical protein